MISLMEISLDSYIKRAGELSAQKFTKANNNEFKLMINYLEETIKTVKSKYESFKEKEEVGIKEVELRNVTPMPYRYISIMPMETNLYWIPELNQYMVKINNMVLRGNLANIYDNKILYKSNIKAHQVVQCCEGNHCANIRAEKYCKYYHDPADLYELKKEGVITDKYFASAKELTRNFSNTSWLYSGGDNLNMRKIGSKSNLKYDIAALKINRKRARILIENMKQQVMHDILVLLILNEEGL